MPEIAEYRTGQFCWVDLATTDRKAAIAFYSELFGWKTNDVTGDWGTYSIAQLGEKDVCGLGEQPAEMRRMGIPPHWTSYVWTTNADDLAKKATELGGKVVAPPFDVTDAGRMAVLQDPTGATFALWQAKKHGGARLVNEPGALCWNELATRDTEAAKQFYCKLLGWTEITKADPQIGFAYTEFTPQGGDRPTGGMLALGESWGPVPPHWAVYFAVAKVDEIVERAKKYGGKVLVPPKDIPKVGRFAVLQDPQGAAFSVITLSPTHK
jgi:predicted enzyme related to lactoylglutathione lyase